jgi:RNA polymerase sigma-70 factor (ECF subfamily)
MLSTIQEAKRSYHNFFVPEALSSVASQRREAYERNRARVYAVAFYMTGNELAAEDLMAGVFRSAFAHSASPDVEEVDEALVRELRKLFALPAFTLGCTPSNQPRSVRRNILRIDLERVVMQLPATEKLIFLMHDVERYEHDQIARLLGITARESCFGLHQARLRLRELLPR